MNKYVLNFNLTQDQKDLLNSYENSSFKNLTFERENPYKLIIQAENPKYIYIESNRNGISDEEKNRLSFFPEYLAGKNVIITNIGLICFVNTYDNNSNNIEVTIYDLLDKDPNAASLNDIAFDTKTMFLSELDNPGYDEYNTPLSYFKVAYNSPADKSVVNFPFDKHQIKYTKDSKLYLSFPVDRIGNTIYNDAGLFELDRNNYNGYTNALCYKYNQLFMFKAKEQLYVEVYGVTNTSNRVLLDKLIKTTTDENHLYTIYVDLSNYLPSTYKYFEFKFTRNSVVDLPDCERFLEVLC